MQSNTGAPAAGSAPALPFIEFLPPATDAEPAAPQTKLICVTIAYGDTLWGIARLFGATVPDIVQLNAIADPDVIFPGNRLYVRVPASVPIAACEGYTVRPGDTLSGIAARFGLDTDQLAAKNNLFDPDVIFPGQLIRF